MPRDAGWNDALAVIFHADVRRGYDHADAAARADPGLLRLSWLHGLIHASLLSRHAVYRSPMSLTHSPSTPGSFDAEVLIAGAGPVGLTAALNLSQRGISVIVLEAADGI